jgi:hypothetical protein
VRLVSCTCILNVSCSTHVSVSAWFNEKRPF